jgi:hypothetical protein
MDELQLTLSIGLYLNYAIELSIVRMFFSWIAMYSDQCRVSPEPAQIPGVTDQKEEIDGEPLPSHC